MRRHLMRQITPAPRRPFLLALIQESNGMMGRWETVARQSNGETGLANKKVVGAKTRTPPRDVPWRVHTRDCQQPTAQGVVVAAG